jgi:hypothetical protein
MRKINLAYYKKEDWGRFLTTIDDRDSMHKTWEEWHLAFLKLKFKLDLEGILTVDFVVDIDELSEYCKKKGIRNDGKVRSTFVAKK